MIDRSIFDKICSDLYPSKTIEKSGGPFCDRWCGDTCPMKKIAERDPLFSEGANCRKLLTLTRR